MEIRKYECRECKCMFFVDCDASDYPNNCPYCGSSSFDSDARSIMIDDSWGEPIPSDSQVEYEAYDPDRDFYLIAKCDGKTVFNGAASRFLADNDGDEEVAVAVRLCKEHGTAHGGGGAAPGFILIKADGDELADRTDREWNPNW